jgi:predicted component of type VI protein secretion system
MSKLLEDEKVKALVQKSVVKAQKDLLKSIQQMIKSALNSAKDHENKITKKEITGVLKDLSAQIKSEIAF